MQMSKLELKQIPLYDVACECKDLALLLCQQVSSSGFVPLSDLQCRYILDCTLIEKNVQLANDPVALYKS